MYAATRRSSLSNLIIALAVLCSPFAYAQTGTGDPSPPLEPRLSPDTDPITLVGITVKDIIESFGAPSAVYAVRGIAEWQDDVVFEYSNIDFYLVNNKVWQISINKALGVNIGNTKAAVLLVLGNTAQDKGSYILQTITGRNWPLQWRFNINNSGKVSSIYLYRMDY
ncbi:MAG: hypothetical protein Ta2B_00180 [Termitinemataceae bacterium]|nr:MAG: hypothetical protein Ta2B_00180 [Termitinemataceae bacterium]